MQTQNKTIISQIMGKPPQRVVCTQHGPYFAFTSTLPNGEPYQSRCPRCAEEDELAQHRLMSRDAASSIVASRLSSAGVPDDLSSITFDGMPKGLRQNTELVRACTKLADGMVNNLVLLGGNGVGKTTLAIATLARIVEKSLSDDIPVSIHYTTEIQLLRALKTTFSRKDGPTEQDIINRISKVDVLVLEEVGMAKDSEYNLTALQEIIDARHRSKRTIICGNPIAKEFKAHLTESSLSKLSENGLSFEIEDVDHRRIKA